MKLTMVIKFTKSFYDWCIENDHDDWLELWDYELNQCSPKDIGHGIRRKYYFKCPKGIHKSELKVIENITLKRISLKCKQCNSFGQYLIDTYGKNALEEYWDYKKNKINPFEISKGSNAKVWIKCQKQEYHGSYEITCFNFYNRYRCPYCCNQKTHPKDSFAQYHIDNTDPNFIEKYWSKKNTLDPFSIAPNSNKTKIWIKCQEKVYHDDYKLTCNSFTQGKRCPLCRKNGGKVHSKDSFAQHHIDNTDKDFLEKYWSDKNTVDPFSIAPNSHKKVWIKCQNDDEHEDYEVTCTNFTKGRRCGNCRESYGERIISKWLDNKNIKYIREKTFPNLLGVGNDYLRYDFYLPEYNLLIEYQGEQHEQAYDFFGGEEKLKQQQEHDRRKKEYAELHNIKLLEILYWDYNNIEEILNKNIE